MPKYNPLRPIVLAEVSLDFDIKFLLDFDLYYKKELEAYYDFEDNIDHYIKKILRRKIRAVYKLKSEHKEIKDRLSKDLSNVYNQYDPFEIHSDPDEIKNRSLKLAIVTLVTTFEIYFQDSFEYYINLLPLFARQFMKKEVKIENLEQHNYDLIESMGTLLLEKGIYNFQIYGNCEEAYQKAFKIDFNKSGVAMQKINDMLQIRHLLVHRDGLIDRDFIEKTHLKRLKEGRFFRLTKTRVKDYCRTLLKLIRYVQDELEKKCVETWVNSELGEKGYLSYPKDRERIELIKGYISRPKFEETMKDQDLHIRNGRWIK